MSLGAVQHGTLI